MQGSTDFIAMAAIVLGAAGSVVIYGSLEQRFFSSSVTTVRISAPSAQVRVVPPEVLLDHRKLPRDERVIIVAPGSEMSLHEVPHIQKRALHFQLENVPQVSDHLLREELSRELLEMRLGEMAEDAERHRKKRRKKRRHP